MPPYIERLQYFRLETLKYRRQIFYAMFSRDIICGRIAAPNILSEFALHVPTINVRSFNALHIPFHRTNYGLNDPLICCIKSFNEFYNFFDFYITRNAFKQNMKLFFFSTELNH